MPLIRLHGNSLSASTAAAAAGGQPHLIPAQGRPLLVGITDGTMLPLRLLPVAVEGVPKNAPCVCQPGEVWRAITPGVNAGQPINRQWMTVQCSSFSSLQVG